MDYKIWIASYFVSPPPYPVENDHGSYKDSEGNVYYLECEPSDELFYSFAKIEYGDTVEYYDWYVPGKETRYGRRIIRN